MRRFKDYEPVTVMIYYLAVTGTAMFCMNPVTLIISLVGAVLFFAVSDRKKSVRDHLLAALLFIVLSLINPFFYHNGKTVLFVVNDTLITLEALVYGVFAATMIISVLYWFKSFSLIMTRDRLLYIFGRLSPKFALVLSMAIRYIPLMKAQNKKTEQTQRALGIYRGDNIADTIKAKARIFSIMVTWSLENGIITADSMAARGYTDGRRTVFADHFFTKRDALFLISVLLLFSAVIYAMASGALTYAYYPALSEIPSGALSLTAYICYALLVLLPSANDFLESLRWKYLMSGI